MRLQGLVICVVVWVLIGYLTWLIFRSRSELPASFVGVWLGLVAAVVATAVRLDTPTAIVVSTQVRACDDNGTDHVAVNRETKGATYTLLVDRDGVSLFEQSATAMAVVVIRFQILRSRIPDTESLWVVSAAPDSILSHSLKVPDGVSEIHLCMGG